MKLMKMPDAATIHAWARETGRPVGSRGAISTQPQNAYVVAQLRRAGLAAGRLALSVAPSVARAAADRRTHRTQ